jgi:hypothetical protein
VITHLHCLRMPSRLWKTGKTLCGVKVSRDKFAPEDTDATCPACRAKALEEFQSHAALIEHIRATGNSNADLEAIFSAGVSYRHVWFL